MEKQFTNLKDFYPYYLSEHLNPTSRNLHFIGTSLFILTIMFAIFSRNWSLLFICPLVGYGFAWVGHFFFEKNKPATFTYPAMSLASDFIMFFDWITGNLSKKLSEAEAKFK